MWWLTKRRSITIADITPEEWGIRAPNQALQTRDPVVGKQSPRTFGSRNQWAVHSSEPQRFRKPSLCFLKGTHSISYAESQVQGQQFERWWVRPTCWSWRAPWRGRRQPWQAPANINPGSSHFWKLILPSGWQAQFWSALSRGLGPEAYIPISWSVQLLRQSSLNNQLLRDPALSTNKPSSFCMGQDLAVKKTSNIFFF